MFRGARISHCLYFADGKLKAVQAMSTTKSEEYNEIANNILLNLFYDEQNLDLIISNVRNYKRQSFGYDSIFSMLRLDF